MRKVKLVLIIAGATLFGCSRQFVNAEYVLEKKYPLKIPPMRVKFLSDSTGIITNDNNKNTQRFAFKYAKHFMVITTIEKPDFVSLQNGDTIVYHKNKLYLFEKTRKLIFSRED
jgi:hypothetical protein